MSIDEALNSIVTSELDYQTLIHNLKGYRFPRNRISRLLKSGQLVRVKKGLYVKSPAPYSAPVLANMIYGPSYVSQHYALALQSLIPERVYTVTSMTLGRAKQFVTPVGAFTYEPLPAPWYSLGVRRIELSPTQVYLVATPEKALIDILWRRKDLNDREALEAFLVEDQRVDLSAQHIFSRSRMRSLAQVYKLPVVSALLEIIVARSRR